jgi:ribosomal protein L37AE/L43A
MITCEQCGKKTGEGPEGKSWICEDCKESPDEEKNKQDE